MSPVSIDSKCEHCTQDKYCFLDEKIHPESIPYIEHYEMQYSKGETVFKQGTIVPHIAFVKKGMIKILLEDGQRKQPLCIEKEGFAGLECMYNDKFAQYTVTALTDLKVCLIEIESFKKAMMVNAKLAVSIIETINIRTKHLYERIFTLTQKQGPGRVADILICLEERIFEADTFYSPCTRKEMAEMCSMSIESLSRILKDFKDDRIIDFDNKQIAILKKEKLELISRVS
jgi:CRP/FNR family transcriptional regulator, polysaccharide utilization system transcription regulator